MQLHIVVAVKQVPDPDHFDGLSVDRRTGSISRAGVPLIINPLDRHALEEALRIKERLGGTVSVITMGPPLARRIIEDALAMGADRGAILCDPSFAGSDTLATARIVSAGIRNFGEFDLVICGNETVDSSTGQVPPQLAEFLNVVHVTHVRRIDMPGTERIIVERVVEGGYLTVEVKLPAVISVLKTINTFRLPSVAGIVEAAGKEIRELDASACRMFGVGDHELGLEGSPTRVLGVVESTMKRNAFMMTGEPEDVAKQLVVKLRELQVI